MEDLLGVSKESVYRRIRGETQLSFAEVKKICVHFNISVDALINAQSDKGALFQYKPLVISDMDNYAAYMTFLLEKMNRVANSTQEKELVFTAQDIPFYHFCKYPDLAFFKLYAWNDMLQHNAVTYEKFYDSLDKTGIVPIYEQIYQAYLCIPAIEIWAERTIDVTLRLLEYYFDTDRFDKKDTILFLLDRFVSLIDTIKHFADEGYKDIEREIPFSLFSCSVDLENNFMLLKRGDHLACILKLYAISRIMTDNESLCTETKIWIDSLISKSILISGNGAYRERLHFFNGLKTKIQEFEKRISQ